MWNPLIKFKIYNNSLRMASLLLTKLSYIDGTWIVIVRYRQPEQKKGKKKKEICVLKRKMIQYLFLFFFYFYKNKYFFHNVDEAVWSPIRRIIVTVPLGMKSWLYRSWFTIFHNVHIVLSWMYGLPILCYACFFICRIAYAGTV